MKFNKYFLILTIIIINFLCISAQRCSSNLECKETGCCHDDKCQDESKCKKRNKFCYGFVGLGAFLMNVIIVMYFIKKIKETKSDLEYQRKTEPGSLARRTRNNVLNNQIIN